MALGVSSTLHKSQLKERFPFLGMRVRDIYYLIFLQLIPQNHANDFLKKHIDMILGHFRVHFYRTLNKKTNDFMMYQ